MSDLCDISSSNHWLDALKIRKETREYIAYSWNDSIISLIYTVFSPIEHWKRGMLHCPRERPQLFILNCQEVPSQCSMDYRVHGVLPARILEWVAFPFSRGSSQPIDQTQVSRIASRFFTSWASREPKKSELSSLSFLQQIFPTQELNWCLCSCRIAGRLFTSWAPRETKLFQEVSKIKRHNFLIDWNFEIKHTLSQPKQLKFCACV